MLNQTVCQSVEAAMSFAQSGKIEDALEIVSKIRNAGGFTESADISVEIMVIEGICSLYSGETARAEDRLGRAAAIASAFGSKAVRGLALCWLAVCQISRGQHYEAARSIVAANEYKTFSRLEVRFRVALVISMLLEYSGCRTDSLIWFSAARKDLESIRKPELMVVALYNLAMVRLGSELISQLRNGKLLDRKKKASDLLFVKSAENYADHSLAKIRFELHDLTSAYALALIGDYGEALERCNKFLSSPIATATVDKARAKFCMAFCRLAISVDVGEVSDLRNHLFELADNDDLAIAHDTLSRIYDSKCAFNNAEFHRLESRKHIELFCEAGKSIRLLFERAGLV